MNVLPMANFQAPEVHCEPRAHPHRAGRGATPASAEAFALAQGAPSLVIGPVDPGNRRRVMLAARFPSPGDAGVHGGSADDRFSSAFAIIGFFAILVMADRGLRW